MKIINEKKDIIYYLMGAFITIALLIISMFSSALIMGIFAIIFGTALVVCFVGLSVLIGMGIKKLVGRFKK